MHKKKNSVNKDFLKGMRNQLFVVLYLFEVNDWKQ